MSIASYPARDIYRFIGVKSARFLAYGSCVGLLSFMVEIAFALVLQQFLVVIGVMSSPAELPSWLPAFELSTVLTLVFTIGLIRAVLQWCHYYLTQTIIEVFNYEQRTRLLDWAFYNSSASSGYVSSFFTEIIANTAYFLGGIQGLFITVPASILLFISLIYIAPLPTLVASLCLVLAGLMMRGLNRKTVTTSEIMYAAYNRGVAQLLRGVKNILLLHIYGTQKKEELEILASLKQARDKRIFSFKLAATAFALPQVIGIAAVCVIALSVSKMQSLAPSLLISYFYLFIRFVQTFAEVAKTGSTLLFSRTHARALFNWWKEHAHDGIQNRRERTSSEIVPKPFAKPVGWELSSVHFSYPGALLPVLENVNIQIQPGETLVVTGPSGVGKSTLLMLLLGGIRPSNGRIRLIVGAEEMSDDLATLRPRLLESIGYVGPESFLIDGTIYENLVYGIRTIPTTLEINSVLEKAECHFVFELPSKLNHRLTEQGEGLSAGQKQRLSLARALLRKPRVLILDEATANLDSETESRLLETFSSLKQEMSIIAVTHRESMLKLADKRLSLGAENR